MIARRLSVIALFYLLATSSTAASADEREFWKHAAGSYVKVDADKWAERDAQGKATFHFNERRRTKEFVSLRDTNRKLIIRLHDEACYIHYGLDDAGDDAKWEKLYEGSWVKK